jgi:predicted dienelactone hydrolase
LRAGFNDAEAKTNVTIKLRRRIVLVCVLGVLAALILHRVHSFAANRAAKGSEASAYKAAAGPFDTGVDADLVLHDARRNKDLHVKITYPAADGKFPVIVFSHGFGGSQETYASLTEYWAARGYVVIQPTHDDSIAQRKERGEIHGVMQGFSTLGEDISDFAKWRNRARDISFVIDSLEEIERRAPAVAGKMDRGHIGVGGHSFGALTTELIGGLTFTPPGESKPESLADRRVSALLVLSGAGPRQRGVDEQSWESITAPMMLMTGTRDLGVGGLRPEQRIKPYELVRSVHKYAIVLDGGGHMTFTGIPAKMDAEPAVLYETVKMASVAFWDAYLKDSAKAESYLHSPQLVDFSGGKAKLSAQ